MALRLRPSSAFLRGSAIYIASTLINSVVPLALLPLLTRYLEPAEYGQVAIFQSLYVALGALVTLEVVGGATRKYFDCEERPVALAGYVTACLQIFGVSGLICTGLMVMFGPDLVVVVGMPIQWLFASLGYAVAAGVIQLRLGQWQAGGEALAYGALQVSQAFLNCAISVVLVVTLGLGVAGRLEAIMISVMIPAAVAILLLRRDGLIRWSAANGEVRSEALAFGMPLIPHALGGFLLSLADRLVIASVLGLEEAGIYSVAAQLCLSLGLIFTAVNNAYAPWLFSQLSQRANVGRDLIVKKTYVAFFVIWILVATVWVLGPWLLRLLVGPSYDGAARLIGWLAIGQGFVGMYFAVVNYLFYERKTALISTCSVVTGFLSLGLLVLAVRYAGVHGAAISFAISMGIRFLVVWWAANRCHPMPWFSTLRLRDPHV